MKTKQSRFKSRLIYISWSVMNNVIAITISNLLINYQGFQVFIYFPLDFNFQHLLESLQEQLRKIISFKRSICFCFSSGILIHTINNVSSLRSSHQRRSVKKVFLEISQNLQENTCARALFEIKLLVFLQKLLRTPFYRTPLDDCF